ncbi:ferritin-like domain-containing protein [Klenkia brasiliensis]|uniref:DUF4439 domain-containing protein n=1 Tax=Klenkia brasiliensis TaxID=333142 RepID=A0A1G7WZ83_9ACTN|nr:ferritin-like domain-containing protein [Klenkia brasiliensis]SDG76640.1 protein of unknown function [Klenkia brasiliensis]
MTSPSGTSPSTSAAATSSGEAGSARAETAALQDALAAEHAAVWGYGTVGAALAEEDRTAVGTAVEAHRDLRDRLAGLLTDRGADPVPTAPAYQLPFPVLSAVDASRLAAQLEDGTTAAWVWVLDQAADRAVRELAVAAASAAEARAVAWRARAGATPPTTATPGL